MTDENVYILENVKDDGADKQVIRFFKLNEGGESYENGTTLEEVLKVLIARTVELNKNFPCRENSLAITKMEEAVMWFNKRTEDRISRGVEGSHQS